MSLSGIDGCGDDVTGRLARSREAGIAALVSEVRDYGERWLSDEWDFAQVTIATERARRRLAAFERATRRRTCAGRALLSPAPADQHDFGVRLLAMRMREAGWDVTCDIPAEADALVAAVRGGAFDLVGLSIGHERALKPVARLVPRLRAAARTPGLQVALGGVMLNGRAALAYEMGADLHADTAESLVETLLADAVPVAA